ncbi:hypothetical protein FACS1894137_00730 [Spirochaetia bacterium]|nr:hypothetical protein FACS1894137_00730 [Spirochaetia bacterium]
MDRLAEKKVSVRNPVNPKCISEIALDPGLIDCIVFWSKNPENFLKHLPVIDALGYRYYFQFTLNAYDAAIERNINKAHSIDTFIALSEYLGREKVIWRYDPILITDTYTVKQHGESFESLCRRLYKYTEKCVISFIDTYPFLAGIFKQNNIRGVSDDETDAIAECFAAIGKKYNLPLCSCAEKVNLDKYGIAHNSCIDAGLIARLFNLQVKSKKDPSQRPDCGCCISRDIGAYNTCGHDCLYCYANRGAKGA